MKLEKIVCEHCGQSFRPRTAIWYSQEISKMLKLEPKGKALDGSPFYHSWRKEWLVEVHQALKKLLDE